MRAHKGQQLLAVVFCCVFFFSSIPVRAEENIQHSTVDYDAAFLDATQIYIGNEKAVDWKVGDKYFLHYTVTKVTSDRTNQSGLLVTKNPSHNFPYEEGGMHYVNNVSICEEGWTYLFRFEVTKTGLKYIAGKAKGTDSSYIQFPYTAGEIKTEAPYFGVWITGTDGGSLTAEFSNIRCYDEAGNDLGVNAPKASKISPSAMNRLDMKHSYSFSVKEAACFAFGSERYSKSNVIMLEYSVENVKAEGVTQSGAELTNAPTEVYPHGVDMGYLNYDVHTTDNPAKLLTEGASYLVRMERQTDHFAVLVKRTMPNGAVDYFSFENYFGTFKEKFGYFAMWIGEKCKVTADFKNVKCYDENGNNLAIQTNQGVEITHYGGLEDYSPCAATYYCKENSTMITLDRECGASRKVNGETEESQGVYSVNNGGMELKFGEDSETCTYAYEYFKDSAGNKYIRLRDKQVTFMSKRISGEVIATITVGAATDYKVERPEDPTQENGNFVSWVDGTGKEYDFDTIVTEAKTLYAVWDGEQEWEVVQNFAENKMNKGVVAAGIVCVLLIGGTVAASFIFVRKRRAYEQEN